MDVTKLENDLSENAETEGFDLQAGKSWIYPTNYPMREYQFRIVQEALHQNTLVSLPTGLGKTFIAAVVMYNFYRWYPSGKIIFLAPTRPLVKQQIAACYDIMAIPQNVTAELTGTKIQSSREEIWKTKRVFFCTPQVLQNDLDTFPDLGNRIKCIVFDEAHKAKGNHAYCEVTKKMTVHNKYFRVLALSATPGNSANDIGDVSRNLLIAHLEIKTENSPDVMPYVFQRTVETVVVPLGGKLNEIRNRYLLILEKYVRLLKDHGVIAGNCANLTKGKIFMTLKDFTHRSQHNRHPSHGDILRNLNICITLYHGLELLTRHGLRGFLNFFEEHSEKALLRGNSQLITLMADVQQYIGPRPNIELLPGGKIAEISPESKFGHPKFYKLRNIMLEYFSNDENKGSKVIIFSEYKETVMEAYAILMQHFPLIRPRYFMGQGAITQKQQIIIIKSFKDGDCNTLISTCIGEEGLDIGEVDMIICFDISNKSPIRLIQRMGRTGRKKQGKVTILVTEGKEQELLKDCLANKQYLANHVLASKNIANNLYKDNPRMIPENILSTCQKMFISVPKPTVKTKSGNLKDLFNNLTKSPQTISQLLQDVEVVEFEDRIPDVEMFWDKCVHVEDRPGPVSINFTKRLERLRSSQDFGKVRHSKDTDILTSLLQFADSKRYNLPMTQLPALTQPTSRRGKPSNCQSIGNFKQTDIRNIFCKPRSIPLTQVCPEAFPKADNIETAKNQMRDRIANELQSEMSAFLAISYAERNTCNFCEKTILCDRLKKCDSLDVKLEDWEQPETEGFSKLTEHDLDQYLLGLTAKETSDMLNDNDFEAIRDMIEMDKEDSFEFDETPKKEKTFLFEAPSTIGKVFGKCNISMEVDVFEELAYGRKISQIEDQNKENKTGIIKEKERLEINENKRVENFKNNEFEENVTINDIKREANVAQNFIMNNNEIITLSDSDQSSVLRESSQKTNEAKQLGGNENLGKSASQINAEINYSSFGDNTNHRNNGRISEAIEEIDEKERVENPANLKNNDSQKNIVNISDIKRKNNIAQNSITSGDEIVTLSDSDGSPVLNRGCQRTNGTKQLAGSGNIQNLSNLKKNASHINIGKSNVNFRDKTNLEMVNSNLNNTYNDIMIRGDSPESPILSNRSQKGTIQKQAIKLDFDSLMKEYKSALDFFNLQDLLHLYDNELSKEDMEINSPDIFDDSPVLPGKNVNLIQNSSPPAISSTGKLKKSPSTVAKRLFTDEMNDLRGAALEEMDETICEQVKENENRSGSSLVFKQRASNNYKPNLSKLSTVTKSNFYKSKIQENSETLQIFKKSKTNNEHKSENLQGLDLKSSNFHDIRESHHGTETFQRLDEPKIKDSNIRALLSNIQDFCDFSVFGIEVPGGSATQNANSIEIRDMDKNAGNQDIFESPSALVKTKELNTNLSSLDIVDMSIFGLSNNFNTSSIMLKCNEKKSPIEKITCNFGEKENVLTTFSQKRVSAEKRIEVIDLATPDKVSRTIGLSNKSIYYNSTPLIGNSSRPEFVRNNILSQKIMEIEEGRLSPVLSQRFKKPGTAMLQEKKVNKSKETNHINTSILLEDSDICIFDTTFYEKKLKAKGNAYSSVKNLHFGDEKSNKKIVTKKSTLEDNTLDFSDVCDLSVFGLDSPIVRKPKTANLKPVESLLNKYLPSKENEISTAKSGVTITQVMDSLNKPIDSSSSTRLNKTEKPKVNDSFAYLLDDENIFDTETPAPTKRTPVKNNIISSQKTRNSVKKESPRKIPNASQASVSDSEDEFEDSPLKRNGWISAKKRPRLNGKPEDDPLAKKRKRRNKEKAHPFIDDEAVLSSDEYATDDTGSEGGPSQDVLEMSFVDDNTLDIANTTDMHARYLQSVRSPTKGQFKIPERPTRNIVDVFSQIVDHGENTYLDDSFCVNVDDYELTQINDLSELEIAEMELEEQRKRKRKGGEIKSDTVVNYKKRRRIITVHSSDSD